MATSIEETQQWHDAVREYADVYELATAQASDFPDLYTALQRTIAKMSLAQQADARAMMRPCVLTLNDRGDLAETITCYCAVRGHEVRAFNRFGHLFAGGVDRRFAPAKRNTKPALMKALELLEKELPGPVFGDVWKIIETHISANAIDNESLAPKGGVRGRVALYQELVDLLCASGIPSEKRAAEHVQALATRFEWLDEWESDLKRRDSYRDTIGKLLELAEQWKQPVDSRHAPLEGARHTHLASKARAAIRRWEADPNHHAYIPGRDRVDKMLLRGPTEGNWDDLNLATIHQRKLRLEEFQVETSDSREQLMRVKTSTLSGNIRAARSMSKSR